MVPDILKVARIKSWYVAARECARRAACRFMDADVEKINPYFEAQTVYQAKYNEALAEILGAHSPLYR